MRNRFDIQLASLNSQMVEMGRLCEVAITEVTEALKSGDLNKAHDVIKADEEIDQMEKEIETLCLKLLLQQQPVARDLRQISAALKMITDMERIGDQTCDIAEIMISEQNPLTDVPQILMMSDATTMMIRNSVHAYVDKNLALAREVISADDKVDLLFEDAKTQLVEWVAEKGTEIGREAIDFIMIAKYLERIADHATNIAEWVEFSITGVHITKEVRPK